MAVRDAPAPTASSPARNRDAPGRIVHVPGVAEVLAVPGVVHAQVWPAVSDVLSMRHPSEWVVFAFLAAGTREGLDTLIGELPRQLTVKTVPVEQS